MSMREKIAAEKAGLTKQFEETQKKIADAGAVIEQGKTELAQLQGAFKALSYVEEQFAADADVVEAEVTDAPPSPATSPTPSE